MIYSHHFDPVPRRGGKMPDAVLPAGIRVRVVGATDLAVRRRDFVLAASLFAVVLVLVQSKPVVARTLVRTGRVSTLVLAAAVVRCTLVHVCDRKHGTDGQINYLGPGMDRSATTAIRFSSNAFSFGSCLYTGFYIELTLFGDSSEIAGKTAIIFRVVQHKKETLYKLVEKLAHKKHIGFPKEKTTSHTENL